MILCTPIAPARTGNGLAMRTGVLLEALAGVDAVDLVVLPVSGPAAPLDWARAFARSVQVIGPVREADARAHLAWQLADPWLRDRLTAAAPLPVAARRGPPSLAADVVLPGEPVETVVACRLAVAPFAVAVARRAGATRVVLDADDDDVALLHALGAHEDADATERLARAWLPEFDEVWAASDRDATALRDRFGVAVRTVPNAVRPPPVPPARAGHGAPSLLFVGNLTYAPNLDAVRVLAQGVVPRVRVHRPDAMLTVVGPHDPGALDSLAADPGVVVTGRVADLAPWYARADVVVVPLRFGAGTRIKVLEAAAFGRPVVASTAAVAGLDLEPGVHALVADGVEATAAGVVALLDDPDRAAAMARAACTRVERRYSVAPVAARIRAAVAGASPPAQLVRRVLWNILEVDAPAEVRDALDAVLPTAAHDFPAGETLRYSVDRTRDGAFLVFEGADALARVATSAAARDLVHTRFHRRVFERASRAGWLRVHGALVDLGGARVLCTGPEGAGKSTLALRLLLDGASVQGDESVVLRRRDAVAVARPLHCKADMEVAVPELAMIAPALPAVDGIRIADPGRLRPSWRLTVAPLDHVVVLSDRPAADGSAALVPASQTEVLPDLVDALFPVVESKPTLLGTLARSLTGVTCHRLPRAAPEAMVRALSVLG